MGNDKGRDGVVSGTGRTATGRRRDVGIVEGRQLFGVDVEEEAQAVGHVVGGNAALVGIAEDGCGAAVAADDDEALAIGHVEHIITAVAVLCCGPTTTDACPQPRA